MELVNQYQKIKGKHPSAIILCRVGDFYETYCEDAVTASKILGITLTKRLNGSEPSLPMASFPCHALECYLPKLIRAGKRVAICAQLDEPQTKRLAKQGYVKRERGTAELRRQCEAAEQTLNDARGNYEKALRSYEKEFWRIIRDNCPLKPTDYFKNVFWPSLNKCCHLGEYLGQQKGYEERTRILHELDLTGHSKLYNFVCKNLLTDTGGMFSNLGGHEYDENDELYCEGIAVKFDNEIKYVINPEGHDYARYVGFVR